MLSMGNSESCKANNTTPHRQQYIIWLGAGQPIARNLGANGLEQAGRRDRIQYGERICRQRMEACAIVWQAQRQSRLAPVKGRPWLYVAKCHYTTRSDACRTTGRKPSRSRAMLRPARTCYSGGRAGFVRCLVAALVVAQQAQRVFAVMPHTAQNSLRMAVFPALGARR